MQVRPRRAAASQAVQFSLPARPPASSAASTPVSTSPAPPVAMPGFEVVLTASRPSGSATKVRAPLSSTAQFIGFLAASLPPLLRRSRLHGLGVGPLQPPHLAGVRGENRKMQFAFAHSTPRDRLPAPGSSGRRHQSREARRTDRQTPRDKLPRVRVIRAAQTRPNRRRRGLCGQSLMPLKAPPG